MRLIDADALKRLVDDEWFDCREKSSFFDEIDRTPTIEPTLYGYNPNHLALIVHEMEEKGITAYKAAEIFADVSAVVQMVLDEQKKAIDAEVKRWSEQPVEK